MIQFIVLLYQLLLALEVVIVSSGLFFSKPTKDDHDFLAAKYDPEMPERVRKLLEKVGNNPIVKIQLGRTPVDTVLLLFLNLLSSGQFNQKQIELGYDEIYHNYLLITILNDEKLHAIQGLVSISTHTNASTVYKLEKAHRVRLLKPVFPTEFVDVYNIPLTPNKLFTLNRLITTASNIDKHFYTYDAANNNMCQTFVENIVDINGLSNNIRDNATRMALKPQDAKALIATLGSRSDIVKKITDLGGALDKWVFDHKIIWKKPLMKEFELVGTMNIREVTNLTNSDARAVNRNRKNIVVRGMTDTIVENADDAFHAAVALEENEKIAKRNQLIITIGSVLLAVLFIVGAIIAVYYIRRNRKRRLEEKESASDLVS